ncbi:STP1 protein, partial [Plasmodium malariae]
PSFSKHKSKFLTDDLLEHPIYDEKEIVKKIKINEFKKNINLSNRKKDRSKTIIEVHMEVLEVCRNEEWENNKEEFLKIFIDEITKKEYNVYPNLTNDDLITQNIKSSNDIPKQNILWNKWIERHRYISEKLKKMDWFNNLKNEWKEELAYMKKMVKLKIKSSNENHKVLFLEREKDIWKQWISKKGTIIEQYLEQECFNEFSEDFHNISDEYLNEDTKNYVSLMNIEEFQNKENYEEFYNYVKQKLVRKLCILVFMTILEECKKEVNFENRELYLDSSINELKKRLSSDKKPVITENIIKYNSNDLEYIKNNEIHAHIGNNTFRNEIENWVIEDNVYANSIVNYGALHKSDEIEEKQLL